MQYPSQARQTLNIDGPHLPTARLPPRAKPPSPLKHVPDDAHQHTNATATAPVPAGNGESEAASERPDVVDHVVAEAAAASVKLTRDTHVQVLDVEDLSLSRWDQVEVLREVTRGERTMGRRIVRVQDDDDGGGGGEVDASVEAPARPAATHRLVLQDCRGTRVYAVELRRIPRLGVGSTAMGEKMLLRAGTVVARGIVLLTPETCLLLGGRVDAWHDAWANSRLRRLEEAAAGPRQQ
ncbi:hypothetical protein XA68_15639 [Ophiocordyceps unilateralis]|uniref:RecQ mediated genome instability protein 1 OB-fold domain-containing protein n=1 Tax=Ophiocordyceps unilateralis TaxID=268505 RepID=A0A2A9PM38_OPHUN|nr:hypothetical protein XA68_15639 [Ophiocordyceps unilateralis]